MTSLDFDISSDVFEKNIIRLINQLWKLIPMRENKEPWDKQLDTVLIEVAGLSKLFAEVPQFLQLVSKLEGLKAIDTSFELYRKTVFECITLLRRCV